VKKKKRHAILFGLFFMAMFVRWAAGFGIIVGRL